MQRLTASMTGTLGSEVLRAAPPQLPPRPPAWAQKTQRHSDTASHPTTKAIQPTDTVVHARPPPPHTTTTPTAAAALPVQDEGHGHTGHLGQAARLHLRVEGVLEALGHELPDAAHVGLGGGGRAAGM
jgi:hypothetical protein